MSNQKLCKLDAITPVCDERINMSMYRSFESTQNYRPLLPVQKSPAWKLWIAIILLVIGIGGFFVVNPEFIHGPNYVSPTVLKASKVILLQADNTYLKGQVTNLNIALIDLTNKFDRVYQLYQDSSSNLLVTLSNMIILTEENGVIRSENIMLLKKGQSTNK